MNNGFNKGVLDAKISRLLSENDFATFKNLTNGEKLAFFINHNLVTTNIVTNFEALCAHARTDLKTEVANYVKGDSLYLQYFFSDDYIKNEVGAKKLYLNKMYEKAQKCNEVWLLYFMDYNHALLNVLNVLRGKKRGDTSDALLENYLAQALISEENYTMLTLSDEEGIFTFVKALFNLDLEKGMTLVDIEKMFDAYLVSKISELAIESDLAPTLIYYIMRKDEQILRLRSIYYNKE